MSNRTLIIIISLVLVLALAAGGAIWYLQPPGAQVLVTIRGTEFGTFPLNKNQTIRITDETDSWYNILEIKDGRAAVIESDCDNQVCVFTPPLSELTVGIIVCLPHGVAVELK